MIYFRYRTAALAGRCRENEKAAMEDAVNAGQAVRDSSMPGGYRWVVPGVIETRPQNDISVW